MSDCAFEISNVAIDAVTWTPIVSPRGYDSCVLKCAVAILIRTDANDVDTEDTVAATVQEAIVGPVRHNRGEPPRFPGGQVILYVQSTDGVQSVVAKFLKGSQL